MKLQFSLSLSSARVCRHEQSRERDEANGEWHGGDGRHGEAAAEVRTAGRPVALGPPGTMSLPAACGERGGTGCQQCGSTYQIRPSALQGRVPSPVLLGPHFTGRRGPRGELALFLPGSTTHVHLHISQVPYVVWVFAQVTPWGLECVGFTNQHSIQNSHRDSGR